MDFYHDGMRELQDATKAGPWLTAWQQIACGRNSTM